MHQPTATLTRQEKELLESAEFVCQQQDRTPSLVWKDLTVGAWSLTSHHQEVNSASSTPCYHLLLLRSWLCLVQVSAILCYIFLSFFHPTVNFTTQHPFQHFPKCAEVGKFLPCSLPMRWEAACQEKVHLPVHNTWFFALSSSALLCSAFVTTHRTAETLCGCSFVWLFFFKSCSTIVNWSSEQNCL